MCHRPRALRRVFACLLLVSIAVLPAARAWAWGTTGHSAIAQQYGETLPDPLQALRLNDAYIVSHIMDPDARKNVDPSEGYRHFIDIDEYPEYAAGTLSHDRAVLEAMYGVGTVEQIGIVPWAIGEVVDGITAAMQAGDWTQVRTLTVDLCHYVGDAHQPLHCTRNYNGQLTGNTGIHSRYESNMLNTYSQFLQFDAGTATYYPEYIETAFVFVGESQQSVAQVLAADTQAKSVAGGSTSSSTYYAELWNRTNVMTIARLTGAAQMTASLVYTAWVNAGYPAVPGSTVDAGPLAGGRIALAAGPNPVRAGRNVTLTYTLPTAARATIVAYDVRGRELGRVLDGIQPAGPGSVSLPGGMLERSGIVLLVLDQAGRRTTARVVVVS